MSHSGCEWRQSFMSDEALEREKGHVLLDERKTKTEIAGLEAQADRIGKVIEQFGIWLRHDAENKIFKTGQEHHGLIIEPLPDTILRVMTDWQQAFEIADKLRKAKVHAAELHERVQRLGL
jgi:hypothetical protein